MSIKSGIPRGVLVGETFKANYPLLNGVEVTKGAPKSPSAEFYQNVFPNSYEALLSNDLAAEVAFNSGTVPVDISCWGEHFKMWVDLIIASKDINRFATKESLEEVFTQAAYYTGLPVHEEVLAGSNEVVDAFKTINVYGITSLEGNPVDSKEGTPTLIFRGLNLRPVYISGEGDLPLPFYYNLSSGNHVNGGEYVPPVMQRHYMFLLERHLGNNAFIEDQKSNPHLYDVSAFSKTVTDSLVNQPFRTYFNNGSYWMQHITQNAENCITGFTHTFRYDPYLRHYFTRYEGEGLIHPGNRLVNEVKLAGDRGLRLLGYIFSQAEFLVNYDKYHLSNRLPHPVVTKPECTTLSY